MKKRSGLAVWLGLAMVLGSSAAFGQAGKDLNKCQAAVAKEGGKYIRSVVDTVGKCLSKVSKEVIERGATTATAATTVAEKCVVSLRKIVNAGAPHKTLSETFNQNMREKCDPTYNADLLFLPADTYAIGATTLSARNLNASCQSFGGGVAIGSFDQWRDCLRTAADCEARQAVATQWPRALEYFAALITAVAALPASPEQTDALTALAALDTAMEGSTDDNVPELACGPRRLPVTGLYSSFGAGDDGDVRAGVPLSYSDNGDGTITDHNTGLMWEKKDDRNLSSVHDVDNTYEWCADDAPEDGQCDNAAHPYDGSVVSLFLDRLNNYCDDNESTPCTTDADCVFAFNVYANNDLCGHAGHRDWRLPNERELLSIVSYQAHPSVNTAAFSTVSCAPGCSVTSFPGPICSCTETSIYWSSTTLWISDAEAHSVDFFDGQGSSNFKHQNYRARAVRGGL